MHFMDFDGEEGLFYQGHGEYLVKRFYRALFNVAKQDNIDSMSMEIPCKQSYKPYLRN